MSRNRTAHLAFALMVPLAGGARATNGCGGTMNPNPEPRASAPDMTGTWSIDYDDQIAVKVNIGGASYTGTVTSTGGVFTVVHQGATFDFDLDCAQPLILCPSEVLPKTMTAKHENPNLPREFTVGISSQTCTGTMVPPGSSECGPGTSNPDCSDVCMGTVSVTQQSFKGLIDSTGNNFGVLLGAGVATNGINCGVLAVSAATGKLETTGSSANSNWEAVATDAGKVLVGYAGGCFWVTDPNATGQVEAAVAGASIELSTGFTGTKQ